MLADPELPKTDTVLPAAKAETDKEHLIRAGWRLVAEKQGKYRCINYWTHDNHQPARHGFFTTSTAIGHQKFYEKHGEHCFCVPKEPKPLRESSARS